MTLKVEEVSKQFETLTGPLVIFEGISFSLQPGESMAVVGPSGSGKSTLLNIIGTLQPPSAGRVLLGGEEVTDLPEGRLARVRSRRIGFVFQDHHLLPQCTALENVLLPTLAVGASDRRDAVARAEDLLERVGLAERMDQFPAQLSGGERQRVAIARAMINGPDLLLADEPTGNLDRETGRTVGGLFAELVGERDVILLLATHDQALAERFGDIHELREGTLTPSQG